MAEVKVLFTKVKGYEYPRLPIPWDLNEKFGAKRGETLKCRLVGRCLIYYRNEEDLKVSAKQLAEELGLSLETKVSAKHEQPPKDERPLKVVCEADKMKVYYREEPIYELSSLEYANLLSRSLLKGGGVPAVLSAVKNILENKGYNINGGNEEYLKREITRALHDLSSRIPIRRLLVERLTSHASSLKPGREYVAVYNGAELKQYVRMLEKRLGNALRALGLEMSSDEVSKLIEKLKSGQEVECGRLKLKPLRAPASGP